MESGTKEGCAARREAGSYEAAALEAVNLGSDTGTTACVAGGLAGLMYGIAGLPPAWLAALQDAERVVEIADRVAIQKKIA